jgi:hypothetical protein
MNKNRILTLAVAGVLSGAFSASALAHESRNLPIGGAAGTQIRMTVGFAIEPAREDTDGQGIDIFLNAMDPGMVNGVRQKDFPVVPITRGVNGDAKLKVEALYLDKPIALLCSEDVARRPSSNPNCANILAKKTIADDFDASAMHTAIPFGEDRIYRTYLRTTHPGAYGFHVTGYAELKNAGDGVFTPDGAPSDGSQDVTVTLQPRKVDNIDEWWVCGGRDAHNVGTGAGSNGADSPNVPGVDQTAGGYNCVEVLPPFPGKLEDGYQANKAFGSR